MVEDGPLVRMTGADELEEAGFQVLFTDVYMPGFMDGPALAEQVHRRWPHVLLLISSGYARPHPDEIPDRRRFMPKPYDGPALVRHITEMMQAQTGPEERS